MIRHKGQKKVRAQGLQNTPDREQEKSRQAPVSCHFPFLVILGNVARLLKARLPKFLIG